MRRIDDFIRAGADIKVRTEFLEGIDRPLDDRGRRVSEAVREREMEQFKALRAATGG